MLRCRHAAPAADIKAMGDGPADVATRSQQTFATEIFRRRASPHALMISKNARHASPRRRFGL